jgi:exodeoxyribonuclease III
VRVVSINVNGIRSAASKGLGPWLAAQGADVVCLQETRAAAEQFPTEAACPPGYHVCHHVAEKKGYSGVSLLSRRKPDRIVVGFGWPDFDAEGRYLQADFGELSVASIYLPSGSSSPERQAVKFELLARLMPWLRRLREDGRQYVLCGDWNIAHKPIDLKNWRANQKSSGFLPEERAWMDELFGPAGFVDAFRVAEQRPEQYTWWSNRGQAWAKNVGWRIDYQVITPALAGLVRSASIYRDARFSDHAPLTIDYDWRIEEGKKPKARGKRRS